jgi:adenylosuccinate synthase
LDVDIEKIIEQYKQLGEYFRPMIIDTIAYLNQAILDGSKKILVEGANATMLDIDFGMIIHYSLYLYIKMFKVPIHM